ncbi:hypothetical protein DTO280E4_3594 [Paecilomyces variotii]|nr:hypothetical protein DTO280E4_3594 [Paecilomyces variotii]
MEKERWADRLRLELEIAIRSKAARGASGDSVPWEMIKRHSLRSKAAPQSLLDPGFIIAPSRYETDSLTPLYLDSRSSSTRSLVHSVLNMLKAILLYQLRTVFLGGVSLP